MITSVRSTAGRLANGTPARFHLADNRRRNAESFLGLVCLGTTTYTPGQRQRHGTTGGPTDRP